MRLHRSTRTGGVHAGLVKGVNDPERVPRSLAYLSTGIVAFLAAGLAGALSILVPEDAAVLGALQGPTFIVGCIAPYLLVIHGVEPRPMSLAEEELLQEESPLLPIAIYAQAASGDDARTTWM